MELLWRCGTRGHNWQDAVYVRRLLDLFARLGLVGEAAWVVDEFSGRRRDRPVPADQLSQQAADLLATGDGTCSLGGSTPGAWEIHIVVSPWDARAQSVDGVNMATLRWDSDGYARPEDSASLFDTFAQAHGPADSEFAFIHPWGSYGHLMGDVYRPPLVTSQTVAGACFALYIGPGQIAFFDVDALASVPASRMKRDDDRAVWFQCLPVLSVAGEPEQEQALVTLTEEMRLTLR
jgi:hypothetical protein